MRASTVLAGAAFCLGTGPAICQHTVPWYTVDCGGGTCQGGGYTLRGTFAQHDAGHASTASSGVLVSPGFWTPHEQQPACPCDLSPNNFLNLDDLDVFIAAFLAWDLLADVNRDGVLNLDDVDEFTACFLGGCPYP